MQAIFEQLYGGQHLAFDQMTTIAQAIFRNQLSEGQLGALLTALKVKGVSMDELAALAEVMQQNAMQLQDVPEQAMDNCGTGGDHSNSFNISTTSAFVLAAGGIPMAKHGNRSVSSRSGSADVLEFLGVNLTSDTSKLSYLLNEIGIAFLFAPALHPSMKAVMKIRKELATPTIFNLIGPLINPVKLDTQLMGTFARNSLTETAAALGKLGRRQALVVHGFGGMDEANLAGPTQCAFYRNGEVSSFEVSPEEYGFKKAPLTAIVGGKAAVNGEILLDVLQNKPSVYLETVVLNAGLGFFANGKVGSLADGFTTARHYLASGAGYDKLQELIQAG